ncbi:hypothetical protein FB451DRAFT_1218216 [Mycena latifolia]|nr:hypothetical protein FB451DRAFT_1218216 [Mycena latifolia]
MANNSGVASSLASGTSLSVSATSIPTSSAPASSSSVSAISVPPSSSSSSSSLPVSSSSTVSSSSSTTSTPISSSTSAPPSSSTTLTTPSTTVSETTLIATSNGQTFTSIVQITSTIAAGSTVVASSTTSQPTSHTGAIVGGVIGGLAFLALLGAGFVWYRRRSRYKTEFDGNFDPARVTSTRPVSSGPEMITHTTGGTLPRMNIDDDDGMGNRLPHSTIGGGIVTPFTYAPTASSRSQSPPMPSGSPPPMSQYSQDGYAPTLSSAGGYYTAVPQQAQAVGGYYPPAAPSSSSASSYNPRSAKEREAQGGQRSAGFAVANPSNETEPRAMSGAYDEQHQTYLRAGPRNARNSLQGEYNDTASPPLSPTASSSGASQRASGVLVHQDGGRVEPIESVREEEADEIPPTYDSLPQGERK